MALFTRVAVTGVEDVTGSVRRVSLGGDALRAMAWTPGQHVRVHVRDLLSLDGLRHPKDSLRTYTIWDHRPGDGALDLLVHLHPGDGVGARWAREARTGQAVTFTGPQGDFVTRPAPYHLFAGEETATVAIGAMIRGLPAGSPVYGVLESESPGDELAVPREGELRRVHRAGAPAASSAVLRDAVAALDLPAEPGIAYLAGEARTCQLVRDHLVRERGWPRAAVRTKPFWTPGKRGMD